MTLVLRVLLNALALWLADRLIAGISYDTTTALFIAALVLGVINAVVRPVLRILTFPITLLTLGLFLLVLNALLFWLVGLVPGFHVNGFLPALLGSLVVSVVSFALSFLVK